MKSHYHCVYKLKYHLVLVTKYRRKCFTAPMLKRLEQLCRELCTKWDVGLDEFGGEDDHIHLMLDFHPNIMPSKFINNLKTVTSRLMRKEFSEHLKNYYWKPVLWTRAYCLITAGGAPWKCSKSTFKNKKDLNNKRRSARRSLFISIQVPKLRNGTLDGEFRVFR